MSSDPWAFMEKYAPKPAAVADWSFMDRYRPAALAEDLNDTDYYTPPPPAPVQSQTAGNLFRNLFQGAATTPGVGLKGVAVHEDAARRSGWQDQPSFSFGMPAMVPQSADAARARMREPVRVSGSPFYEAGDRMETAAREAIPVDPARAHLLSSKVSNAIGQSGAFIGAGLLTGGSPLGVALTGAAVGAGAAFDDAIHSGASEEDAALAASIMGAVGTSEALPVGKWVGKILGNGGGSFLRRVRDVGQESIEEALQEFFQTTAGNVVAQSIYDDSRTLFEDAPEAAKIGGISGAIMSAAINAIPGRRRGGGAPGMQEVAPPVATPPPVSQSTAPPAGSGMGADALRLPRTPAQVEQGPRAEAAADVPDFGQINRPQPTAAFDPFADLIPQAEQAKLDTFAAQQAEAKLRSVLDDETLSRMTTERKLALARQSPAEIVGAQEKMQAQIAKTKNFVAQEQARQQAEREARLRNRPAWMKTRDEYAVHAGVDMTDADAVEDTQRRQWQEIEDAAMRGEVAPSEVSDRTWKKAVQQIDDARSQREKAETIAYADEMTDEDQSRLFRDMSAEMFGQQEDNAGGKASFADPMELQRRISRGGKLAHPDMLRDAGDPLAGEVRDIYNALNLGQRRKIFAGKKEGGKTTDSMRESLVEQGFDFSTPDALLQALDESLMRGRPQMPTGRRELMASVEGDVDADYMAAVERGDTEAAQKMVDAWADQAGYEVHGDFRDGHRAPVGWKGQTDSEVFEGAAGPSLLQVSKGVHNQPQDYFDARVGPRYYMYQDKSGMESFRAITQAFQAIKTKGEKATIEVFRAVPKDRKGSRLENRDWVSPSRTYAVDHGESRFGEGEYRIVKERVPVTDLYWDGNDIREWGKNDDGARRYKNTPNNIKSADPITRDDAGNVIPVSRRFDETSDDIRYSISQDPLAIQENPSRFTSDGTTGDIHGRELPAREGRRADPMGDTPGRQVGRDREARRAERDRAFASINDKIERGSIERDRAQRLVDDWYREYFQEEVKREFKYRLPLQGEARERNDARLPAEQIPIGKWEKRTIDAAAEAKQKTGIDESQVRALEMAIREHEQTGKKFRWPESVNPRSLPTGKANPNFPPSRIQGSGVNIPAYSIGEKPSAALNAWRTEVGQAVREATQGWRNAPSIEVVLRSQLPAEHLRELQSRGIANRVEGFYDPRTQKVFLVADNLTPKRAVQVALHEVVGHYGLRAVLGDRYMEVMDAIARKFESHPMWADTMRRWKFSSNNPQHRLLAAEEIVAQVSELGKGQDQSLLQKIIRIIKEVMGWQERSPLTDGQIRQVLSAASKYVEGKASKRGRESTLERGMASVENDIRYSIAEDEGPKSRAHLSPMFSGIDSLNEAQLQERIDALTELIDERSDKGRNTRALMGARSEARSALADRTQRGKDPDEVPLRTPEEMDALDQADPDALARLDAEVLELQESGKPVPARLAHERNRRKAAEIMEDVANTRAKQGLQPIEITETGHSSSKDDRTEVEIEREHMLLKGATYQDRSIWENIKEWLSRVVTGWDQIPGIKNNDPKFTRFRDAYNDLRGSKERIQMEATQLVDKIMEPITKLGRDVIDADTIDAFRKLRQQVVKNPRRTPADAARYTAQINELKAMEATMLQSPYALYSNLLLYKDLVTRANMISPRTGMPVLLPRGLSKKHVEAELNRLVGLLNSHKHREEITQAMRNHYQAMSNEKALLEKYGYLIPAEQDNPFYYPHLVIDYMSGKFKNARVMEDKPFRGYMEELTGSKLDIESNYISAVYSHFYSVRLHNNQADFVREGIEAYDRTQEIREQLQAAEDHRAREKGETPRKITTGEAQQANNIPEGWVLHVLDERLPFRPVEVINREALGKALGITITQDADIKKVLKETGADVKLTASMIEAAMVIGTRKKMVIPVEMHRGIKTFVHDETKQKNAITEGMKMGVRAWKVQKLYFPTNWVRYEFNNLATDIIDKVLAGDPGVLRKFPRAWKEVRAFWKTGEFQSKEMREAYRNRVLESVTAREMNAITDTAARRFEAYATKIDRTKTITMDTIKSAMSLFAPQITTGGVARNQTEGSAIREGIFRYAKYLASLERIEKGADPIYQGASKVDVEATTDSYEGADDARYRKAAKIARRTFVDYGEMSANGEALRAGAIPFWSWIEGNWKYHNRLVINLRDMVAAGEISQLQGHTVATVNASRVAAGLLLRLALPHIAMHIWNNVVAPHVLGGEDDDDLEQYLSAHDRRRTHIITGFDPDTKRVRVMYINTALGDVLEWFAGQQFGGAITDSIFGRAEFGQAMTDWAKQAFPDIGNKLVQSGGPTLKIAYTATAGKRMFPDVFDQRSIPNHELGWAVLEQMVDKFTADQIRDVVDKDFIQTKDLGDWAQQLILQQRYRNPESWAYYTIRDKAAEYAREKYGTDMEFGANNSKSAAAVQGFRRGIYHGDPKTATHWYLRLLDYGYTKEQFQGAIRGQNPLNGIRVADRKAFIAELPVFEQRQLELAMKHYAKMRSMKGSEDRLFPSKSDSERTMQHFRDRPRIDLLEASTSRRQNLSPAYLEAEAQRLIREEQSKY